jgi:glycosyltransferase involved in cell wall biosynthesis
VFISKKTQTEVLQKVAIQEDKIDVIPNPVNIQYKYSPKEFNSRKPVILHVGGNGERKNLANTIEAIKDIKCHLRIIGNISAFYKNLLAINQIEYSNVSNLSDDEIVTEYENCDIVNFPSKYEGFGMPIIEGQATGRVVLTSNHSPMKDVAGEGAYLVDAENVKSIKEGYEDLISKPVLRAELIRKGLENVKKYKVEDIAAQYKKIYNEL